MNSYVVVFPSPFARSKSALLASNVKKILKVKELAYDSIRRDGQIIIVDAKDPVFASSAIGLLYGIERVAIAKKVGNGFDETVKEMAKVGSSLLLREDKLRKKYSMHLQVLCPDTKEVEEMVNAKGQNLFYESTENRILCCKVRKVNPINRILPTLDGWITGIRKEHSKNRNSMQMFQIDEQHGGILKINPIIDWSLEQIMEQIRERQIPYNALLDQNYSSIGCAPCTRAIKPGEDLRAGRWWWESQGHSECGLHMNYTKKEENN